MGWLDNLIGRVWSGSGGRSGPRNRWSAESVFGGWLPGSDRDFESEAGPPWLNATISACLNWFCDELPQSRFLVQKVEKDQTISPVWNHRLTRLLAKPNPFWTGEQLWQATLADYLVNGNAYWLTYLSDSGEVAEVWRLDPEKVEPQWPDDGSAWISYYLYQPEGIAYRVPIGRIVHFRDRPDPANPRKGLGRIQAVLREIAADNEASTYTYTLLKNLGQTGVVISAEDAGLSIDQATSLVRQLREQTTGDRRFRPIATSVPVKTSRLGDSPEQLKLDSIPKQIEARICAAIGVSPLVLWLPCAADFATFANADQAIRLTWSRLIAIQRNFAATIRASLLPLIDPNPALTCGWDWSEVSALQSNATDLATRAKILTESRILTRKEGRELVGFEPIGNPAIDDAFIGDGEGEGDGSTEPGRELTRAGGPALATFRESARTNPDQWIY